MGPDDYRKTLPNNDAALYTEADIVKVFFAPTELRTQLMWFQTVIYGVFLLFAVHFWIIRGSFKGGHGMQLLNLITPDEIGKKSWRKPRCFDSDLNIMFALVTGNRHRSLSLEIIYNTLHASTPETFLTTFREIVFWQLDGREYDGEIDRIVRA